MEAKLKRVRWSKLQTRKSFIAISLVPFLHPGFYTFLWVSPGKSPGTHTNRIALIGLVEIWK